MILHALIARETNGKFGIPGYDVYLYPMVIEWYIGGVKPQGKEWMMNCYNRSFLNPDETKKLLIMINSVLPQFLQKNGTIRYISPEEKQRQCLEKKKKWEQEERKWRENQILKGIKQKRARLALFCLMVMLNHLCAHSNFHYSMTEILL